MSPSTIRTESGLAVPWSGAMASPSSRPITQLCNGQVTVRPATMPSDNGPFFVRALIDQREDLISARAEDGDRPAFRLSGTGGGRLAEGMLLRGPIFFQFVQAFVMRPPVQEAA